MKDTHENHCGTGIRLGLAKEERFGRCGEVLRYIRSSASFLAGKFEADYRQLSDDAEPLDPPIEVDTSVDSARIVPMLELELGVGWESPCRHWRW